MPLATEFQSALAARSEQEYLANHCNNQTASSLGEELLEWVQCAPRHQRIHHSSTEAIASCMTSPQKQYAFIMRMSSLAPRCQRTYHLMALQEVLQHEIADYLVSDLGALYKEYRSSNDYCDVNCIFCEGLHDYADGSFFAGLASCVATVSKQPFDVNPMQRTDVGRVVLCIMLADSLRVPHDARTLLTWERFPESLRELLEQDALGIVQRASDTMIAVEYPYISRLMNKIRSFIEQ